MRYFGTLVPLVVVLALTPPAVHAQTDLTGQWTLDVRNDPGSPPIAFSTLVDLVQEGRTLSTTFRVVRGQADLVTGSVDGTGVRLQWDLDVQGTPLPVVFEGVLSGGSMTGTVRFGDAGTGLWAAERGARSIPEVPHPVGTDLPNPHPTVVREWGRLPDDRTWGTSAGVAIGPDGHIWAYDRCGDQGFADVCSASTLDPILKFDRETGEVLTSFGAGLFAFPHGIHVDAEGNVWITDSMGNDAGTVGHQVIKFSPDGEVLLTLGEAGVPGDGPDRLNEPTDVITAPNGDIFVADGHSGHMRPPPVGATARIVKFTAEGRFIKEWGSVGSEPGEFRTPHALALDSRGRLFVADRGNNRLQIFDQEGTHLDSYEQFSRVSDIFIDADDTLYAIDSESNARFNPGWLNGIRIGSATEDRVVAFVPPHWTESGGSRRGVAGEGIAVDADGDIYVAEGPISRPIALGGLTKYLRRR